MKLPETVTRTFSRQLLTVRKHSPHILFVGGLAGVVTSTVLACRATLKVNDHLDQIKAEVEETKHDYYNPSVLVHKEHTLVDHRKELAYVYFKGVVDLSRLYGPSIVIGTASIAALTGSHVTLARRNTALAAAYTGLSEAFSSYRSRVRAAYGDEKEQELYSGMKMITDKEGNSSLKITDPAHKLSPYAQWFDCSNPNWQKTSDLNRWYIEQQQIWLNDLLRVRGHVFLNEAYDELGLPHTKEGAVVGWLYPAREGCDGFIDFGIYASRNAQFHIGDEYQILLDFNVDGLMWDLI